MCDPTISDADLYDAVSDAELNEVNSGDLQNLPSYVQATLTGISDEISSADAVEGNVGDADNGDATTTTTRRFNS